MSKYKWLIATLLCTIFFVSNVHGQGAHDSGRGLSSGGTITGNLIVTETTILQGDVTITANLTVTLSSGEAIHIHNHGGVASSPFIIHNSVTGSDSDFVVLGSGFVSVGTATPTREDGQSGTFLEIENSSSPSLVIDDTGQASAWGLTALSNDLRIYYGTTALFTFQNDGNFGINNTGPGTPLDLVEEDAATNTVTDVLTVEHITTATAVAGFGVGWRFELEENDGTSRVAGQIDILWDDAGETTAATASMVFGLMASDAAPVEKMRIDGNGAITQETQVIRKVVTLSGATDATATNWFTITTTNESGSADGGSYSVNVHVVVNEAVAASGASDVSASSVLIHWARVMASDGTGINSVVSELNETASADAGSGNVVDAVLTITETSEFVQQVLISVDTGNSGTFDAFAIVELVYTDFTTAPVIN